MRSHQPRLGGLAYRYAAVALFVLLCVALLPLTPGRGETKPTQEWSGYLPYTGQATSQDVVVPGSPYDSGASTIAEAGGVVAAALDSGIAFYETSQGSPEYLGRTESRGTAVAALSLTLNLLYSAERDLTGGRLVVYDWSDPDNVTAVGGTNLDARPRSMAGPILNRLYVGAENGEITVFDTSQAPMISELASFTVGDSVPAVMMRGNAPTILYAVVNASGGAVPYTLRAFNVSNPAMPLLQQSATLPSEGTSVDVDNSLAVVGTVKSGVTLLQLPSLQVTGSVTATSTVADVALSGSTLLVSDSHFVPYGVEDQVGIRTYDVANPMAPTALATVAIPREAGEFTLADSYLYVATPLGVEVVDVSSPTQIVRVGRASDWRHWFEAGVLLGDGAIVTDVFGKLELLETVGFSLGASSVITDTQSGLYAATTDEDGAYVMGDNFLMSLDVSVPTAPAIRGVTPNLLALGDPLGGAVALSGDVAFAGGMWGLAAVDVSDPQSMAVLGELPDVPEVRDLNVMGTDLLVATENSWQLRTINATSPVSSPLVVEVSDPGTRALVRYGNNVYVGGAGFLHVYDLVQPPNLVSSVILPGTVADMVSVRSVLYVAYHEVPMQLVDISNPTSPNIVGSVTAVPYAKALALDGPRLLVIGGDYLRLLNVEEPTRPMPMGRRLLPG